jgi:peptide/nickel transport system permease protein
MATQQVPIQDRFKTYSDLGLGWIGHMANNVWDFSKKKPLGGIGLFIIAFIAVIAIFGPMIAPQDELRINSRNLFENPQWTGGKFILGTDHLGRDNLSRLIIGTRVSITVAVVAVAIGSFVGFFMGLVSGYYPGWVDSFVQRLVDMKMAFPTIVLALAIVSVLGRSQQNIIIAIALVQIASKARIVRAVVLSVRTMEYVQAARAIGASDWRILLRHITPQTFAPAMILVTASLGLAILIESSLAFLGLGTPPPKPSWGSMLSGQTLTNLERAPWNAVFPGLALTLTVFSFNLLGDALRDVLDPRLKT